MFDLVLTVKGKQSPLYQNRLTISPDVHTYMQPRDIYMKLRTLIFIFVTIPLFAVTGPLSANAEEVGVAASGVCVGGGPYELTGLATSARETPISVGKFVSGVGRFARVNGCNLAVTCYYQKGDRAMKKEAEDRCFAARSILVRSYPGDDRTEARKSIKSTVSSDRELNFNSVYLIMFSGVET